ncbi:MAG: MerR family transcriptional regulator [Muribaculaceae bacterium]|nr:MerR family transcriptional regulator [Muribaculaceae bacterium]MBQ7853853.1 MerR family transcriptional regulator [Muribaculaceae bacterium]
MKNDLNKKYYKIREVAEILHIPASTLRYWEGQFTIIKPKRNEHGTRLYTPSDIETIKMVYYLVKEKGLKLDAAQDQIRHNHSNVSQRHKTIERLKSMRAEIKSLLDALHSLR